MTALLDEVEPGVLLRFREFGYFDSKFLNERDYSMQVSSGIEL